MFSLVFGTNGHQSRSYQTVTYLQIRFSPGVICDWIRTRIMHNSTLPNPGWVIPKHSNAFYKLTL